MDINPLYCKIMLMRLLHYRKTGETGWGQKKVLENGRILFEDKVLIS